MRTGDRIAERRNAKGLSQTKLAGLAGVSQATIAKLEAGISSGSSHLHKIARVLETTSEYLTGETDNPAEGAVLPASIEAVAEQLELVAIEEIDLAYGMGGTFTDLPVAIEIHHFPRAWVERFTRSPPSMLTLARGDGDSMEPTVRHGDMLIIDRAQKSIRQQDVIWALTIGEIGMVKRVRVRGEQVTILSDNPSVPEQVVHADEVNVVGRIVFVGKGL